MLRSWLMGSTLIVGVLLLCVAILDWTGYGLFIQALWYQ